MKFKTIFIAILLAGLGGAAMSGYLSWFNLWGPGCTNAFLKCGGPEPILIFGLPTCVYGFFMFLLTAILAVIGMMKTNMRAYLNALLVVTIVGVLFSGFLTYYELFVQDYELSSLPACAYGLILYAIALVFTVIGLKKHVELVPTHE